MIIPDDAVASINAATGIRPFEEALKIGEHATNMARVFNIGEGFQCKDDTLPERIFQGLQNGS